MEALESRLLLSGNYTVAFTSLNLPADAVAGSIVHATAKLLLTNVSNNVFAPTDRGDIHIVLRPVGENDALNDIELGKSLNQPVGIAVGVSKPFTIQLTVPANAAVGDFNVVALATATTGGAELATGTAAANYTVDPQQLDFGATLGVVTLPTLATSGSSTSGSVQVKITNLGNFTSPTAETIDITLTGIAFTLAGTPTIQTMPGVAVGKIKPGGFKLVTVKFNFPITLGSDTFQVKATLSNAGATAETSTANNSATTAKSVAITQGVFDLAATFNSNSVPSAVIAGGPGFNNTSVKVTNNGNFTLGKLDSCKVQLFARPVGGGADMLLTTSGTLSLANLKSHGFKLLTVPAYNASFLSGNYNLVAKVVSLGTPDSNAANDEDVSPNTVIAAAAFFDLVVDSATETFAPTVAGGANGTANVVIKNIGNSSSSAGYKVEVFATDNGTIPGGAIPVGTFNTNTVSIKPGATVKVPVSVTLGEPVATTPYILVARVTRSGESLTNNDEGVVGNVSVTATPPLLGDLHTTYGFHETFSNPVLVLLSTGGTLNDGQGNAYPGGYNYDTYSLGPVQPELKIVFNVSPTIIFLNFNGPNIRSLDGRIIIFQRSKTGSSGSFHALANSVVGINTDVNGYFKII